MQIPLDKPYMNRQNCLGAGECFNNSFRISNLNEYVKFLSTLQ